MSGPPHHGGIAICDRAYYRCAIATVSLKLPDDLLRDVETEARRRGVSKSAVIRDELAARLLRRRKARVTCADLAGDLIGSVTGPADLSTNPRYLDEAI